MSAAILQQLFRPPALDDFPGPFARRAREVAMELRDLWERTCRAAAEARKVEELHAVRDEYHALLKGHIRLLDEYRTLTELHQRAFGPNPARTAELDEARAELHSLYDSLFPRWQTLDDLYQILIEKFS